MSKIFKKPPHCKGIDDHQKYLSRITKTLYYGRLPRTEMLSLPVTELAVEIFSEAQKGRSLERLHFNTASEISRNACVSPCSLVLAMLYFERLKKCNIDYLERTMPSDLFLVSLMVSSKFLFDDGQVDEVFMDEWAASSGMTCKELVKLEKDFLKAIDWELFVSELLFWDKLHQIESFLALKQGKERGHFTYTELETLGGVALKDLHNLLHCVIAVSMILAATYTAALFTIVGSFAIASTIPGTSLYQIKETTVPITKNDVLNDYSAPSVSVTNQSNIVTFQKHHLGSEFNAVKVLKASILLASIKSDNSSAQISTSKECRENCQQVNWDWWNIPIMTWLSRTSEFVKSFELEMPVFWNYVYFLENKINNEKYAFVGDHIQKATKTRIQDQLERSWHEEWTDSIKCHLPYYNLLSYLQTVKS